MTLISSSRQPIFALKGIYCPFLSNISLSSPLYLLIGLLCLTSSLKASPVLNNLDELYWALENDEPFKAKPTAYSVGTNLPNHPFATSLKVILKKVQELNQVHPPLEPRIAHDLAAISQLSSTQLDQISAYTWQFRLACHFSAYYRHRLNQVNERVNPNELHDLLMVVSNYLERLYQSGYVNQYRKNQLTQTYGLVEKKLALTSLIKSPQQKDGMIARLFAISRMGEFQNNRSLLSDHGAKQAWAGSLLAQIEPLEIEIAALNSTHRDFSKLCQRRNKLREKYLSLIGDSHVALHNSSRPEQATMAFFEGQTHTYQCVNLNNTKHLIIHNNEQLQPVLKQCLSLLEDPANPLKGSAHEREKLAESLQILYGSFFRPLPSNQETQWSIDADGLLLRLPFEALLDDDLNFLVDRISFKYLHGKRASQNQKTLNDEVQVLQGAYENDLLKLPQIEIEVKMLEKEFKATKMNQSLLASQEGLPDLTYIAAHQVKAEGGEAVLLLSDQQSMTRSSIYTSSFITKAFIINACASLQGLAVSGEGTRSFGMRALEAGSQQVIANLWQVEDATISQLAIDYLHELKKGTWSSTGLAQAKRSFIKTADEYYSHPFFWAPMLHLGNDIRLARPNKFYYLYLLLVPLVLLIKVRVRISLG